MYSPTSSTTTTDAATTDARKQQQPIYIFFALFLCCVTDHTLFIYTIERVSMSSCSVVWIWMDRYGYVKNIIYFLKREHIDFIRTKQANFPHLCVFTAYPLGLPE